MTDPAKKLIDHPYKTPSEGRNGCEAVVIANYRSGSWNFCGEPEERHVKAESKPCPHCEKADGKLLMPRDAQGFHRVYAYEGAHPGGRNSWEVPCEASRGVKAGEAAPEFTGDMMGYLKAKMAAPVAPSAEPKCACLEFWKSHPPDCPRVLAGLEKSPPASQEASQENLTTLCYCMWKREGSKITITDLCEHHKADAESRVAEALENLRAAHANNTTTIVQLDLAREKAESDLRDASEENEALKKANDLLADQLSSQERIIGGRIFAVLREAEAARADEKGR